MVRMPASNMFDTRLSKRRVRQNIAHQTRVQKKCFKLLFECLMAFKFYRTRPNTIKHIQPRSNSTKQGVQTVKCLVTKQCLMVFGRQTFIVCPGANLLATHFNISMIGLQTMFDSVWWPNIFSLSRPFRTWR